MPTYIVTERLDGNGELKILESFSSLPGAQWYRNGLIGQKIVTDSEAVEIWKRV